VIVGREGEIQALTTAFDIALGGSGAFFLVAGEAGIGKTELARWASEAAAQRGFLAAWARGWDGEGAPPYWPFIQIFRAMPRDEHVAKLAELAPEIVGISGHGQTAAAGRRFALFDAAAACLREVATTRPLLLVVDDLHAVAPTSLSMLNFVARELRHSRVVVLGTYRERDGGRQPDIDAELLRLVREAKLLRLERLDAHAVATMIERYYSRLAGPRQAGERAKVLPPLLLDVVVRNSEGVPLFVEEILRAMTVPGATWATTSPLPAGVRGAVHERLGRLDEETRRLLECASVIGRTFSLALVSLLMPGVDAHDIVERAARVDVVLRASPGRYDFAHAMLREALYRDIPGGARAKLHAAVLDALKTDAASSTLAERAYHALRAASVIGVVRAAAVAKAAADEAMAAHAFEDAASLLRRMLSVLDVAPAGADVRADIMTALTRARAGERSYSNASGQRREPQSDEHIAPSPREEAEPPAFSLLREGELWTARLGSAVVRLKDSRGLQLLAQLVDHPGLELHALALSAASTGPIAVGDAGEVLDREAIGAYRERLIEVEEELREAEAWNDVARVDSTRSEVEFLRGELSRALGLGGRPRRAGTDAERARVNCQRRIRDAVSRIADQDATIGRHLMRAVRTGTFCVYDPSQA
jgi:hypothetical protein